MRRAISLAALLSFSVTRRRKSDRLNPHAIANAQGYRCGAGTRRANPCQSPAMRTVAGYTAARHRGPKGDRNALKHGLYTAEAIARRKSIADQDRAEIFEGVRHWLQQVLPCTDADGAELPQLL